MKGKVRLSYVGRKAVPQPWSSNCPTQIHYRVADLPVTCLVQATCGQIRVLSSHRWKCIKTCLRPIRWSYSGKCMDLLDKSVDGKTRYWLVCGMWTCGDVVDESISLL